MSMFLPFLQLDVDQVAYHLGVVLGGRQDIRRHALVFHERAQELDPGPHVDRDALQNLCVYLLRFCPSDIAALVAAVEGAKRAKELLDNAIIRLALVPDLPHCCAWMLLMFSQ